MSKKKKPEPAVVPHNQSWAVSLVATLDQVFHEIVPAGQIVSLGSGDDSLAVVDYQAACGCLLARLVLGHPESGDWLGYNIAGIPHAPRALSYALTELARCEEIEYVEIVEEEDEGGMCPTCAGQLDNPPSESKNND